MSTYRYILEKTSKKYGCPSCGQKTLTRFIDIVTGQQLADHVGRCDREDSCSYIFTPKQFFSDNKGDWRLGKKTFMLESHQPVAKPVNYLPTDAMEKSTKLYDHANLPRFLMEIFGEPVVSELCKNYFIGGNKNGDTTFWQIDITGKIRQAKIMYYDKSTGRRSKDKKAYFAGKMILDNDNAHLEQCFFGEHLLSAPENANKHVAIVESEKTALISSVFYPQFIWIATGGKHGCRWTESRVCDVLRGRAVILYPDLGAFITWKEKGKLVASITGCKVVTIEFLETIASDDDKNHGLDIADYLLKVKQTNQVAFRPRTHPASFNADPPTSSPESSTCDQLPAIEDFPVAMFETRTGPQFDYMILAYVKTETNIQLDLLFDREGTAIIAQTEKVHALAAFYKKDFSEIIFNGERYLANMIIPK